MMRLFGLLAVFRVEHIAETVVFKAD